MKRAVRRRCGFGCVICGTPVYTIEHIEPWAKVLVHEEDNLTLLCWTHQQESTASLLPKSDIEKANADPFNLKTGSTVPHALHFSGARCRVEMGNAFTFLISTAIDASPLRVYSKNLIDVRFEDGNLLLSVDWTSDDGEHTLRIEDNELVMSTGVWDIDWVKNRLTLRYALRHIALELVIEAPSALRITRGTFYHRGVSVKFTDRGVVVNPGGGVVAGAAEDNQTGICIGHDKDVRRWGAVAVMSDRLPPDFDRAVDATEESLERRHNRLWEEAYRMRDTEAKPPWIA